MNGESSAVMFAGALAFVMGIRVIYRNVCGFSSRMANDVFPFLLRIDMEALYGTFHPDPEEHFRTSLPPAEFKRIQWKRIHLAIHYCDQITNNAQVFLSWTRYEQKQSWLAINPGVRKTVRELRTACLQSRLSVFVIKSRLRWWLFRMALLPFAPAPSFVTLVRLGSWEMITFYERMKALAEVFSLAYGEEYHEKLMQAL